jgi:hypothetical protein
LVVGLSRPVSIFTATVEPDAEDPQGFMSLRTLIS